MTINLQIIFLAVTATLGWIGLALATIGWHQAQKGWKSALEGWDDSSKRCDRLLGMLKERNDQVYTRATPSPHS